MMGTGKSTIGKMLARKLRLKFYDSDQVLENREGISIAEIHEFRGKSYFQRREEEVIKEILSYGIVVLSTGAGSFINKEIHEFIKLHAISVWLDAGMEVLYQRVSKRDTRPELMVQGDKRDILEKLVKERVPVFNKADIRVNSELEIYHIVANIIKSLEKVAGN